MCCRLRVNFSQRRIEANVATHHGTNVVTATTKEWYLEEKLYAANDTAAAKVLGETMAQRLLESGITAV